MTFGFRERSQQSRAQEVSFVVVFVKKSCRTLYSNYVNFD